MVGHGRFLYEQGQGVLDWRCPVNEKRRDVEIAVKHVVGGAVNLDDQDSRHATFSMLAAAFLAVARARLPANPTAWPAG